MEVNTVMATEGVKHLLAIGFQMGLVRKVHNDMAPGFRDVRHIVLLGIVGDKPVEDT